MEEKNCEVNKALKKYLKIEVTEEIKNLFQENADTKPGIIVCRDLLGAIVTKGEKPIRGRFPQFEQFCQFSDGSFISVNSLALYQGPQRMIAPVSDEQKAEPNPVEVQ